MRALAQVTWHRAPPPVPGQRGGRMGPVLRTPTVAIVRVARDASARETDAVAEEAHAGLRGLALAAAVDSCIVVSEAEELL